MQPALQISPAKQAKLRLLTSSLKDSRYSLCVIQLKIKDESKYQFQLRESNIRPKASIRPLNTEHHKAVAQGFFFAFIAINSVLQL